MNLRIVRGLTRQTLGRAGGVVDSPETQLRVGQDAKNPRPGAPENGLLGNRKSLLEPALVQSNRAEMDPGIEIMGVGGERSAEGAFGFVEHPDMKQNETE